MFACGRLDEIRGLPVLDVKRDVVADRRLVGFDGEVVMGCSLGHKVIGQLALDERGISGEVLAFDGDGLQQQDGHADFVRLLEHFDVARYGQGADFFWV